MPTQSSNQLSNDRDVHDQTLVDVDGRSFPDQTNRSPGNPHRDLASGRRGRPLTLKCQGRAARLCSSRANARRPQQRSPSRVPARVTSVDQAANSSHREGQVSCPPRAPADSKQRSRTVMNGHWECCIDQARGNVWPGHRPIDCWLTCGQGRGRTADLPLFRRTLVPTELPDLSGPDGT